MITRNLIIQHWIKLVCCGLLLSVSIESYGFDTLFTTPQQRATFNLQRSMGHTLSSEPKAPSPLNYTQKQDKIFFNGYVIRKSGPSTAWANNKILQNDNKGQQGVSANLNHLKGTAVPVKTSAVSRPIRLQPGQNLNVETGEVSESYKNKKTFQQPASKKLSLSNSSQDIEQTKFPHKTEEPEVPSLEVE